MPNHHLILILALAATSIGCATPLRKVLNNQAPTFRESLPPTTDSTLGGQEKSEGMLWWKQWSVAANKCFSGLAVKERGPNKLEAVYDEKSAGDLQADLGSNVQGEISGEMARKVRITLTNLEQVRLSDVQFIPEGGCVEANGGESSFSAPNGITLPAITHALKAGTINIDDSLKAAGGAKLELDPKGDAAIHASAKTESNGSVTWSGVNLFIARRSELMTIVARQSTCIANVGGASCSIAGTSCVFALDSTDAAARTWSGVLSCPNQATGSSLQIPLKNLQFGRIFTIARVSKPNDNGVSMPAATNALPDGTVSIAQGKSINVRIDYQGELTGNAATVHFGVWTAFAAQ